MKSFNRRAAELTAAAIFQCGQAACGQTERAACSIISANDTSVTNRPSAGVKSSVNSCAYLSTSVLMTASVSSTRLSTFCFFLLGSWGPRPRRGGLTGSLGRLLLASPASTTTPVPWSTRLACPRVALDDPCWWSSKSLSSRHTQLLPMVPVLETTEAKVSQTVGTEFERER